MHPAELYPTELRLTVGFVVTRRLACPYGLTARLCSCGRINAIGSFAPTPRGADLAYGFILRQLIWWAPFIPLVCSCAERTGGDVLIALGMALERRRGRRHPVPCEGGFKRSLFFLESLWQC